MKKVLYLLLFVAACKSSSPDEKVDRIAVITEHVLINIISTVYQPETFNGDVEHISEATYREFHLDDGYISKDTILKEYLFRDHRLHQVATITRRMPHDTLTIQYDTTGRISAFIYSDHRSTYNVDRFKYDAAGRRVEMMNRIYSTERRQLYEYNKTGDSLYITKEPGGEKQCIYIKENGDVVTVTYKIVDVDMSSRYEYNSLNQPVTSYYYHGGAAHKRVRKYDSQGNCVAEEFHYSDAANKDGYGGVDPQNSNATVYVYDKKDNWTSRKVQQLDKSEFIVTTRKITYR
jgi:hypothetical protein